MLREVYVEPIISHFLDLRGHSYVCCRYANASYYGSPQFRALAVFRKLETKRNVGVVKRNLHHCYGTLELEREICGGNTA